MSMEKDTCQKSGTSVIFQKEIISSVGRTLHCGCRGQRFESAITP